MNQKLSTIRLLPSGVTHQVAPFLGSQITQLLTLTFKVLCKNKLYT